jgi:hypothetical protein
LRVSIASASSSTPSLAQSLPASPVTGVAPAVASSIQGGLRPDHVVTGPGPASLVPLSRRPTFVAIPSLMMLAFSGAFFWVGRRRDISGSGGSGPSALLSYRSQLSELAKSNDPRSFFRAARAALQQALGSAWQVPPDLVTAETTEARLGAQSTAAQVFRLADEAAYSNQAPQPCDLQRWYTLIELQLKEAV